MSSKASGSKLAKELKLVDVYAISTGAMFSSGFFLLPGLAFAISGPWVIAAYLISAILVIPAMLSKAELASAMPKAGGTYYFLDRSMGPLVGTIGGLGTWVAMGLKNTFALIGMGAYLSLVLEFDIKMVALALTVVFALFNIAGAKETAGLQRVLVFALVSILGIFVVAGLYNIFFGGVATDIAARFSSAPQTDITGVFATVGLVFVSYAGLTKTVSVAEEVDNPDRNIIRGMVYSLMTAAFIYVVGSFVLVMVVDHTVLSTDLTPIATAAVEIFSWLPAKIGLYAILVAAVAAFASTANAGIMAASRYLLAMGRDKLVPTSFGKVGRFRTPTLGVLASAGFIAFAVLTLDVLTVAKLASAFQLLMFALVNLAVIVMREAKLDGYDPAYRSPFYPWAQLIGIFSSLALIVEMGKLPMLFSLALVAACVLWFFAYAQKRVVRRGAILHWFERLGRERFDALDTELREIVRDKGLRDGDPYEAIVDAAAILDLESTTFAEVAEAAALELSEKVSLPAEAIADEFVKGTRAGATPTSRGVALPHFRMPDLEHSALVVVRVKKGVAIDVGEDHPSGKRTLVAHAIFFLISPEENPGQHLRILAKLATMVSDNPNFIEDWCKIAPTSIRSLLADGAKGPAKTAKAAKTAATDEAQTEEE